MRTEGCLEGHAAWLFKDKKEMLITVRGQGIVSSYSYWKFKSRNSSDYVKRAHPHTFR